eukprot:12534583-Ditylum_brightwellii.AAC.1
MFTTLLMSGCFTVLACAMKMMDTKVISHLMPALKVIMMLVKFGDVVVVMMMTKMTKERECVEEVMTMMMMMTAKEMKEHHVAQFSFMVQICMGVFQADIIMSNIPRDVLF